jgi:HEAT repeat protein
LLRRSGPQAEDALIAGLADPDRNLQRHCVSLLQEVATVKSIPALKQIASEKHSDVADTARTILHRLDPEHNNAITDLLSELDSQQMMSKREPLEKLSAMTPDDHYRAAVVDKAKQLLLDRHGAFFNGEAAGKVLITWANDPKIVPEMLSLLNQDGDRNARHAAMQVLANLKDKRAVIPILRWLLLDSEPAIDALKQMGPMVETDVAVHLRDKEPAARLNAARVLEAVGSPKSYEALNRAAHDSRDLAAKEAAQAALDAIKERTASKPATTTPAPR